MRSYWQATPRAGRAAFAAVAVGAATGLAAMAVAGVLGGLFGVGAMALAFVIGLAPLVGAGLMLRGDQAARVTGTLVAGGFGAFLLSSLLNLASPHHPPGGVLADFYDVLVFLGAVADGVALTAVALLAGAELRQRAASGSRSPRRSVR